jgi:hypothetical protein
MYPSLLKSAGIRVNHSRTALSPYCPCKRSIRRYPMSSRIRELLRLPTSLIGLMIVSSMPWGVACAATQSPEKPIARSIALPPSDRRARHR